MIASFRSHFSTLKALLAAGADVNTVRMHSWRPRTDEAGALKQPGCQDRCACACALAATQLPGFVGDDPPARWECLKKKRSGTLIEKACHPSHRGHAVGGEWVESEGADGSDFGQKLKPLT